MLKLIQAHNRKGLYVPHLRRDEVQNHRVSHYHATPPRQKPQYQYVMNLIQKQLPIDASILEVGCGTGLFGTWLKNTGYTNYIGVDIHPFVIEIAKQYAPTIDFKVMDGAHLEFKDKSFDFVGYINSFFCGKPHRWYKCEEFLDEGLRVSKKWLEFDTAHSRPLWEAPSFNQVRRWLRDRGLEDKLIVERELPGQRRLWVVKL